MLGNTLTDGREVKANFLEGQDPCLNLSLPVLGRPGRGSKCDIELGKQ